MSMKKFYREFTIEKAAPGEGDSVTIQGWANKSIVDDVGDLMKFDQVDLERFKKNPILFYNHDRNLPIGKVTDIKLSNEGMWVKAVLSKSKDAIVSYVRDLISEGILKTFSIGFEPQEEKFNKVSNYNEISKWKLLELSVVTLPCNTGAEFSLAKSLGEAKSLEEARNLVLKAIGTKAEPPAGEPNVSGEDTGVCPDCGKKPCECKPQDNQSDTQEEEAKKKTAFQECVSAKIPKLIDEGKPEEQAVAIAMSMCREEGKCDISIMSPEMFDHAMGIAKGCKKPKPKKDEEGGSENSDGKSQEDQSVNKDDGTGVATPVSQPSDDPTNYGNPHLDLMKAQLALLGKISTDLGSIKALLEKEEGMGENGNGNPALPPPQPEEASAKELARIAEIQCRIDAMCKDL